MEKKGGGGIWKWEWGERVGEILNQYQLGVLHLAFLTNPTKPGFVSSDEPGDLYLEPDPRNEWLSSQPPITSACVTCPCVRLCLENRPFWWVKPMEIGNHRCRHGAIPWFCRDLRLHQNFTIYITSQLFMEMSQMTLLILIIIFNKYIKIKYFIY